MLKKLKIVFLTLILTSQFSCSEKKHRSVETQRFQLEFKHDAPVNFNYSKITFEGERGWNHIESVDNISYDRFSEVDIYPGKYQVNVELYMNGSIVSGNRFCSNLPEYFVFNKSEDKISIHLCAVSSISDHALIENSAILEDSSEEQAAAQEVVESTNGCGKIIESFSCETMASSPQNPIVIKKGCNIYEANKLCEQRSLFFEITIPQREYVSFAVKSTEKEQEEKVMMSPNISLSEIGIGGLTVLRTSNANFLNYEMLSWQNDSDRDIKKIVRLAEQDSKSTSFDLMVSGYQTQGYQQCGKGKDYCYELTQFPAPESILDGYRVKVPEFSYLRREFIDQIRSAARLTHKEFPNHSPVTLLNMSYLDGSVSYEDFVRCARMGHKNGYEIDISYFQKDFKNDGGMVCKVDPDTDQCLPGSVYNLDSEATAYFIVLISRWQKVRFTLSDEEIIKEIIKGGEALYAKGKISKLDLSSLKARYKLKDLIAIHYSHMHVQTTYDPALDENTWWSPVINDFREGILNLAKPGEENLDICD